MIPGLPDRRNYGNLSLLKPQQVYTLLRQLHNARRAGLHTDFRIGSPQLGLYSWAAPKDLPAANQKHLFITQPLHTYAYKYFTGPIKSKYGMGTVQKVQQSPVVILQNTGNKIKFTRGNKRNSTIYSMIKTRNGNWITTVYNPSVSPVIKLYSKQHFKNISLDEAAELMDQGAKAYPKIDGTGALAQIKPNGIQVYGINKDKNGNLIRYTDHIGGLRNLQIPKQLVGKTFRAQVAGVQDNKPIAPNVLSGLLNSTLQNNINARKQKNIQLGLVALAIAGKQDNYDKQAVNDLVAKLHSSKVVGLKPIESRKQLMQALNKMRAGKHPLTNQGFIIQQENQRPVKAKLTQDADVVVRDIFPAQSEDNRAGGFTYSLPGEEKIVGRVGSGIQHKLLKQMLQSPEAFIGQTARITAQQQYPSGAYRAPRFIAFRSIGD